MLMHISSVEVEIKMVEIGAVLVETVVKEEIVLMPVVFFLWKWLQWWVCYSFSWRKRLYGTGGHRGSSRSNVKWFLFFFFLTISFFLQKKKKRLLKKNWAKQPQRIVQNFFRKLINFLLHFPCLFIVLTAFFYWKLYIFSNSICIS